jgi:hypothetical protein
MMRAAEFEKEKKRNETPRIFSGAFLFLRRGEELLDAQNRRLRRAGSVLFFILIRGAAHAAMPR